MKRLFATLFAFLLLPSICLATEVKEITSSNGFKAWLVEEHALPLVAVRITFRASGSAFDPDGKEGRANMTSALLMEGAGDLDARAFSDAVESRAIGMTMGVDEDLFNVSLESLSEHKDKAFYYLGLALTKPRFDTNAIERVKNQTLSIINEQQSRPGYLISRGWREIAFGAHPYGKEPLGTQATLPDLAKSDFENYAKRYLTKQNILVSAVGDITPEELSRLLDEHLGALPDRYDPDSSVAEVTLPTTAHTKTIALDVPQTMVAFGSAGIKRSDPDYLAAYVMNQILGGGGSLSAKLGREIREKRGLAYAVFSELDPLAHAGSWRGGFATRNEQVDDAISVLNDTLRDFANHGPADQEFKDAKTYLTGAFPLSLDSNADIAQFLIVMQLNQLGIDYLDRRNAMIEAITKDHVAAMAKKLADPARLQIVLVGKPKPPEKESP